MLNFKLIISDESGELHTLEHSTSHNSCWADFDGIESSCESFIASAIPEVEGFLLEKAQKAQQIGSDLKKTESEK